MTRNNNKQTVNVVQRDTRPSVSRSNAYDEFHEQDGLSITIDTVVEDIKEIEAFYSVNVSKTRTNRLQEYLNGKLTELRAITFHRLDHEAQTDFILLQNFLLNQLRGFESFDKKREQMAPILEPFAYSLVDLIERRQSVTPTSGEYAGGVLSEACTEIDKISLSISKGIFRLEGKQQRFVANQAAQELDKLQSQLVEWYDFYNGFGSYDPLFTFWTSKPYDSISQKLISLIKLIREKLVGISPDDDDAIIGDPVGRNELLGELQSSFIAYTPEELVQIAEREYTWCEKEMITASRDLGYGNNWKAALEHVKTMYPPIGRQPEIVHELATEAIEYVKKHDMVTVPPVAEDFRSYMMPPKQQKVAPFFLGGSAILIAYPTSDMSHEDKLMTLRGNSRPFSRAVVFHELIPGHHLQSYMIQRYRRYRNAFTSSFWMEGWALYWELILYDRNYHGSSENKIGALFWRMHRCMRIIFSLQFHLGNMTPEECIDLLVDRVGHERSTAEGEVRRSFSGDWSVLYQAGYLLGAMQIYALRQELVDNGKWSERDFHDRILKEGQMPIEILRALLRGERLGKDHEASWRFADSRERSR